MKAKLITLGVIILLIVGGYLAFKYLIQGTYVPPVTDENGEILSTSENAFRTLPREISKDLDSQIQ